MGIKDLSDTFKIKKKDPNRVLDYYEPTTEESMSIYSGKTIAIDMGTFSHAYYNSAMDIVLADVQDTIFTRNPTPTEILHRWLALSLSGLKKILKEGIIPILVWDGPPPEAKDVTKADRAKAANKKKASIKTMRESIAKFGTIRAEEKDRLRSNIKGSGIDKEVADLYESFMSLLGLPSLKSVTEADPLCMALCGEATTVTHELGESEEWVGKVADAVYTNDSDIIIGSPAIIKKIFTKDNKLKGNVMTRDKVLNALEFDLDTFIELCIMLGCDYNHRIRMVGPVKCLKMLNQYGTIENYAEKTGTDIKCLNVEKCKELFSYRPWKELVDNESESTRINNFKPKWNPKLLEAIDDFNSRLSEEEQDCKIVLNLNELRRIYVDKGYIEERKATPKDELPSIFN